MATGNIRHLLAKFWRLHFREIPQYQHSDFPENWGKC
jgi:nitrogen fixation protein